ncbi:MAG: type II secretion system F family protein [Phycisphaeraceae bacterium]|nr:type II secretion system F family protein [Phycisphaeraceae bacterium]
MPTFKYVAMTAGGERVAGSLAAASEQSLLQELEGRSLTPVLLTRQAETDSPGTRRVASTRQVAVAYAQLADLLRAGVPLLRALRLLANQKSAPRLSAVFAEVSDAVASGSDLAEAMSQHPEAFATIHVAMVRAGEKGGFLEAVLARLGQFLNSQADLRARILGSLIYPCVLVAAGILAMGLIFGVFIPMFRQVFDRMPLGFLTRAVLAISDGVHSYGLVLLLVLAAVGVVAWRVWRREDVRAAVERARLRLPVLGPLTRMIAVARFCRILGTMLANSIPVLSAMQIARDAAGLAALEEAIDEATEAVRQGQPLAPPLQKCGLFPEDVLEMISVGESANTLDTVLVTVADTLEARLDRMLSVAVKLIEPAMLMIMAVIIGLVAMALILPMTQMGRHLSG